MGQYVKAEFMLQRGVGALFVWPVLGVHIIAVEVPHTTRHLKCRSNWQRRMVLFLMVLTASKYIINKALHLMSFKSVIKSTIRRIGVV